MPEENNEIRKNADWFLSKGRSHQVLIILLALIVGAAIAIKYYAGRSDDSNDSRYDGCVDRVAYLEKALRIKDSLNASNTNQHIEDMARFIEIQNNRDEDARIRMAEAERFKRESEILRVEVEKLKLNQAK